MLGEHRAFRVAYDGKDIEIMALGPKHEGVKELLSLFINEVHDGLEIDCWGLGSTTWKRPELGSGIEADLCYCFDPAKLKACEAADARHSNDVADYPNPDLAVEVDLSPSKIDRPAIYRAMQVSELSLPRGNSINRACWRRRNLSHGRIEPVLTRPVRMTSHGGLSRKTPPTVGSGRRDSARGFSTELRPRVEAASARELAATMSPPPCDRFSSESSILAFSLLAYSLP